MTPKTYDHLIMLGIVVLLATIFLYVIPSVHEGIQECNEAAEKYDECSAQTQEGMKLQDTMPIFKINISESPTN